MYDMGVSQDSPTLDMMRPVCKDVKRCLVTARLPEYVRKAFRRATSADSGPVYLELPVTTLLGTVPEEQAVFYEEDPIQSAAFGDPARVKAAAKVLAEAKKPVLVLGEQCRYSTPVWGVCGAAGELFEDAGAHHLPARRSGPVLRRVQE